jgi:hypothetical protein
MVKGITNTCNTNKKDLDPLYLYPDSITYIIEKIYNIVDWRGILKPEYLPIVLKPLLIPKDFYKGLSPETCSQASPVFTTKAYSVGDHSPTIQKATIQRDSIAQTDYDLPLQRADPLLLAVITLATIDVSRYPGQPYERSGRVKRPRLYKLFPSPMPVAKARITTCTGLLTCRKRKKKCDKTKPCYKSFVIIFSLGI